MPNSALNNDDYSDSDQSTFVDGMFSDISLGLYQGNRAIYKTPKTANGKKIVASVSQQFIREAQTLSLLKSKLAPKLYELKFSDNGLPQLIIEYIDGINLANHLKTSGKFDEGALWKLGFDLSLVLLELQQIGRMHRDIKPANIILDKSGNFRLIDYGFSNSIKGNSLDISGLGSLAYTSPEVVATELPAVDLRSDLYSIGVVLYQAASQARPFSSEDVSELANIILNQSHIPISHLRKDLSAETTAIIDQLLSKDMSLRPEGPRELCELFARKLGVALIYPEKHSETSVVYEVRKSQIDALTVLITEASQRKNRKSRSTLLVSGRTNTGLIDVIQCALRQNPETIPYSFVDSANREGVPLAEVANSLHAILDQIRNNDGSMLSSLEQAEPTLILAIVTLFPNLSEFFKMPSNRDRAAVERPTEAITILFRRLAALTPIALVFAGKSTQSDASAKLLKSIAREIPNIIDVHLEYYADKSSATEDFRNAVHIEIESLDEFSFTKIMRSIVGGKNLSKELLNHLRLYAKHDLKSLGEMLELLSLRNCLAYKSGEWSLIASDMAIQITGKSRGLEILASINDVTQNELDFLSLIVHCDRKVNIKHFLNTVSRLNIDIDPKEIIMSLELKGFIENHNEFAVLAPYIDQSQLQSRVNRSSDFCRIFDVVALDEIKLDSSTASEQSYILAKRLLVGAQTQHSEKGVRVLTAAADFAIRRRSNSEAELFLVAALVAANAIGQSADELKLQLSEFYLATHQLDKCMSQIDSTLGSVQDKVVRARSLSLRGRCHLAHLNADLALSDMKLALTEVPVKSDAYPLFKVVKCFAAVLLLFVRPLRRFIEIDSKEMDAKASCRVNILADICLASFHALTIPTMIEATLIGYLETLKASASPAAIRNNLGIAVIFANLKLRKRVFATLDETLKKATALGNATILAEFNLYKAFCLDFLGMGRESFAQCQKIVEEDAVWLDHANYLNLRYFLQWHAILQGEFSMASKSMARISSEIYDFYPAEDTRRIIEHSHQAVLETITGNEISGQTLAQKADSIFSGEKAKSISAYYRAVFFGERILQKSNADVELSEINLIYNQYLNECDKATRGGPMLTVVGHLFYALYACSIRIRRNETDAAFSLRKTFPRLGDLGKFTVLAPQVSCLKAAESIIKGDLDSAADRLQEVIETCESHQHSFGKMLALEFISVVQSKQGAKRLCHNSLVEARRVAYRIGAMRKFNSYSVFLNSEGPSAASRQSGTESVIKSGIADQHDPRSSVLTNGKVDRFVAALSLISSSLCNINDPKQIIADILDKMILLVRAERGFVVILDSNRDAESTVGRDCRGQDIVLDQTASNSVVRNVISTSEVFVSGVEVSENITSESILQNSLKSIVALPLHFNDKLTAVVYFDSRVARGLFRPTDVELLKVMANHVAVSLETAKSIQNELNRQNMKRQLALTGAVQNLLIPKESSMTFENVRIHSFFLPADESGGDWFYYYPVNDQKVVVLIGDVTGHGPGPAMVTALVSGAFRQIIHDNRDVSLAVLSERLHEMVCDTKEFMMTMMMLSIDKRTGSVEFASFGGPPAILWAPHGRSKAIRLPGSPLGISPFKFTSMTFDLKVGEHILVFTDGLIEMRQNGTQFGMKSLRDLIESSVDLDSLAIHTQLSSMVRDTPSHTGSRDDDVTYVLIERVA